MILLCAAAKLIGASKRMIAAMAVRRSLRNAFVIVCVPSVREKRNTAGRRAILPKIGEIFGQRTRCV